MEKKIGKRLCAAVLVLAALFGLLPAALAASVSGSGGAYVVLDDVLYLSGTGLQGSALLSDLESGGTFSVRLEYPASQYAPDLYRNARQVIPDGYEFSYYEGDSISDLLSCYFDADSDQVKAGTYTYRFVGYNTSGAATGTYTLTLTVGASQSDLYVKATNGSVSLGNAYSTLYSYASTRLSGGTPSRIRFLSWTGGDLWEGGDQQVSTGGEYALSALSGLTFELDDGLSEGALDFAIYSTTNAAVAGTLRVTGETTAAITYKTDYNTPVTFRAADFEALLAKNYEIDYVRFPTLPASSEGVLSLDGAAITRVTEVSGDQLDQLCFTPVSTLSNATVTVGFTLRMVKSGNVSSPRTISGTVAIQVGKGGTISYRTEMGELLYLDAGDFYTAFDQMVGQNALRYVKFSGLPARSKGVLYVSGEKKDVAVTTSTEYYYDDDEELLLGNVYFDPAANFTGEVTFTYDAYGSKTRYHMQGQVVITVIAGQLADVVYQAEKGPATLDAGDFDGLSYLTFDQLPLAREGVLYYNYSASKAVNTKVNTTTQYRTTGKTGNLVANVTFVPASTAAGAITIPYTGYDAKGNRYAGRLLFRTFEGTDTVLTYASTGLNTAFSVQDFQNACLRKLNTQLSAVRFTLADASQGKLYYGYGTKQQTPVSPSSQYLVGTHLQYVSFLPKAGFSGVASISYTGYDTVGQTYEGTIQVTVTPPSASLYFRDADAGWVAPSVDFLYTGGVYTGVVSGGALGVGTPVTRGEVMQMIYNAFDLKDQVSSVTSHFTDVPVSNPYYTAINAAYQLGVAQGIGDGRFAPDALITRQDAMTLLYRAFVQLGLDMTVGSAADLLSFGDRATVDSWAVDGVASMVKSGIIGGDQNGNLSPQNNLARGDVSVILHRAMTL
jgi:hypothetical protein